MPINNHPRALWNALKSLLAKHMHIITRLSILAIFLFLVLHILYPPIIDAIGKSMHMSPPSLPAVLTLAILVLVFERMAEVEEHLLRPNIKAFYEQSALYTYLEEYIEERGVSSAELIQYSCRTSRSLLRKLMNKKALITVYMQDPNTCESLGSKHQKNRVTHSITELPAEFGASINSNKISFMTYVAPASVSAVRIDDNLIAMGWYIYKHVDESNRSILSESEDKVELLGHCIPAVLAAKGSMEFEVLNSLFDSLTANFKKNSTQLYEKK
jgi:hypothetical protein